MEHIHCPSLVGEDISNQIQDALNKYGLVMNYEDNVMMGQVICPVYTAGPILLS